MRKLILFILILSVQISFGQYTSEESGERINPLNKLPFQDRLYTGGNVGFNIQSDLNGVPWVFFEASPYVGYRITQKYSAGVGAKYMYSGAKQYDVNWSIYGGNIFNRFLFNESLFGHAEFEVLRAYDQNPNSSNYFERALAPMLFAGAGYSSSLGSSASFQIMILYDLINNLNSPYQTSYIFGATGPPLIYRIGFNIGL